MDELYRFKVAYNDLTSDVISSNFRRFTQNLADWVDLVETSKFSKSVAERLGEGFEFAPWYGEGLASAGSMLGSGELGWARDRSERMKQTFALLQHLTGDPDRLSAYSSAFSWAGSNLDDNAYKFTREIFAPFARDFMRLVDEEVDGGERAEKIPAADRIVTIDHNSAQVMDLDEKLAALQGDMEASNSLKGEADFERNLAEVSAGRRLLQASRVRVAALMEVLVPALKWVGGKAGEGVMGVAVTAILVLLAQALGVTIPGLG